MNTGYSFQVDWWSLGILLYEIMFHNTPFDDENQKKIFENIVNKEPSFPKFGHQSARDLIRDLLAKDPAKRLNFETMRVHPFFKDLDWNKVENLQIRPTAFKGVQNELDPDNFVDFGDEPPLDSISQTPNITNLIDIEGFSIGPNASFHEIHPGFLSSA